MKRYTNLKFYSSVVLLIFFTLILYSCQKDNPSIHFFKEMSESIFFDMNQNTFSGEVSIWLNENKELNLVTRDKDKVYVYILQGVTDYDSKLDNDIFDLIYLQEAILLYHKVEGKLYYICLNNKEGKKYLGDIPSKYKQSLQEINGFGLVRQIVGKKDFEESTLIKKASFLDRIDHTMCSTGGEGASSCSVTAPNGASCTTNCTEGFYACCVQGTVSTSCKCVAYK